MSPDEKAAAIAWESYYKIIIRFGLQKTTIEYMHDAFFAGFYAGRDYQRDKEIK